MKTFTSEEAIKILEDISEIKERELLETPPSQYEKELILSCRRIISDYNKILKEIRILYFGLIVIGLIYIISILI